jgi:hypothetical protein
MCCLYCSALHGYAGALQLAHLLGGMQMIARSAGAQPQLCCAGYSSLVRP